MARRRNPWKKGKSRRAFNAAKKAWRTRKRKYGKKGHRKGHKPGPKRHRRMRRR